MLLNGFFHSSDNFALYNQSVVNVNHAKNLNIQISKIEAQPKQLAKNYETKVLT